VTQPALFTPLTIRSVTFRNRVWVPALCQYTLVDKDGIVGDWHLVHLGSMAAGGAGLVIAEATGVSPEARISDEDTGIWNAAQQEAWARVVSFIHSQGAAAGIQLAHAGRKASVWPEWGYDHKGTMAVADGGWQTIGPSDIPFGEYAAPVAATLADIEKIVQDFTDAAIRSIAAGFDVLELHAAHGYLLHQFLSPLSNQRSDEYGGSLENRARLLLRIVTAIREAVGDDVPLFVRFSATDYAEGGWDQEQTATVAGWARDAGADFFDISTGGNILGVPMPVGPGYQVPFAAFVGASASVEVSAVGLITEAEQAERIVASGHADAVMLGREMMRDPHFALRAAHELGAEIDYWPKQYLRARWHGGA
jgi:2,4-dienoyl-CoA reductase-like NADH-dependent reductase (Old Yellow Enzyme family)